MSEVKDKKTLYEIEWYSDFDGKVHKRDYRNLEYLMEKYTSLKVSLKHGYCKVALYSEEAGVKTVEDDYLFGFNTSK